MGLANEKNYANLSLEGQKKHRLIMKVTKKK